jgi:hypothetical protein
MMPQGAIHPIMLAAKWRLCVAPVPPQAADLTPPGSTAVKVGRPGHGVIAAGANLLAA